LAKKPSVPKPSMPVTDERAQERDQERSLVISDLHVAPVADREHEILVGIDLTIRQGEVHAVMGPNGSGKTTLAYALLGHPAYIVTHGQIVWKGLDITKLSPDKRARLGLFLAFQYPTSIPGLSVASFLRTALNARNRPVKLDAAAGNGHDPSDIRGGISMGDYRKLMRDKMEQLAIDPAFAARYVNEGFSGGEKKRLEMLQMAVLEPELAILDETDSGLDIDALRVVAEGVNRMLNPDLGVLLITHYQRILDYITPHQVHVLGRGRIIQSGGADLARQLEKSGYAPILAAAGLEQDARDEAARDEAAREAEAREGKDSVADTVAATSTTPGAE
jgi:Fe-S cluster assembly ATP-binding protein